MAIIGTIGYLTTKADPTTLSHFERPQSFAFLYLSQSLKDLSFYKCLFVIFLSLKCDRMPKETKTYPCDICKISFSRNWLLQRHLASKHPSREKLAKFICHICLKACDSEEELHIHWESHPNPKEWKERQSALSKSAIGVWYWQHLQNQKKLGLILYF